MTLENFGARIARFDPFKAYYRAPEIAPDYSCRLSNDILLQITHFLSIPELLSMRLVSRRFNEVTYTPVIWKRLLKQTDMRLPPVPPTKLNSYRDIKPEICEQILRRAYAVEHEWQRKSCRPAHNFFDARNPTHYLAIVPGGRFLAAASTDASTNQAYLSLWDLELPTDRPFLPSRRRAALARTTLPGKILEMTVKYLPYQAKQGIALAVVGSTENCYNNNKSRFWAVYWIALDGLEEYSKACSNEIISASQLKALVEDERGPFHTLTEKYTNSIVSCLCLETISGKALVTLIRDGLEIVIQNLETGIRSFILPLDPWDPDNDALPPWRQRKDIIIRMVKVLPTQNQLLVIREIRHHSPVWPVFWYEVYDLPPPGTRLEHAMYTINFQEADIKSIDFFHCSESFFRSDIGGFDQSINQLATESRTPTPSDISIWAVNTGTTASDGLASVILRRLKPLTHETLGGPDSSSDMNTFSYCFDPLRVRFPGDRPVAISGGAQRGLWFLPPREDDKEGIGLNSDPSQMKRVGEIVRYLPTEMDPDQAPPEHLQKELVSIRLPPPLSKGLKIGMTAHAFDEGIGRLALTMHGDSLIHVLDFSDHVGIKWDS